MPVESIGPFTVNGPQDQIELVKKALKRLDDDVDPTHFIRGPFDVIFHPVGNVPGTNKPAYGFFHGAARRLEIRNGMNNARDLRPAEVEYTFLHEAFGHGGEHDGVLNVAKRREILNHMEVPIEADNVMRSWRRGATPEGHAVDYWSRPYEAYCDLLVAAISQGPALFERKYLWDIDPKVLKVIVLRNEPQDADPGTDPGDDVPDPKEDPDPVPDDPKDGEKCAELRERVGVLQIEIDAQLNQISTQQTQIGTQQTEIGTQQAEITALQAQIASMEAALNTARRDAR